MELRLIKVINDIDRRLQNLEKKVSKIPDPFILYYRPPGKDYMKISDSLDDLYGKINMLEMLVDS